MDLDKEIRFLHKVRAASNTLTAVHMPVLFFAFAYLFGGQGISAGDALWSTAKLYAVLLFASAALSVLDYTRTNKIQKELDKRKEEGEDESEES